MNRFFAFACMLFLVSCGGGGGGSDTVTPGSSMASMSISSTSSANSSESSANSTSSSSASSASSRSVPFLMGGSIQGNTLENIAHAIALTGTPFGVDESNTAAQFISPHGLTTDGRNLFVIDGSGIYRIVIETGEVVLLAGDPSLEGSADGTGTTARFFFPANLTTDGTHLFVTDVLNHTIRKIVISTGEVTTIAGVAGEQGYLHGVGSNARFQNPIGITTDGTNLYVSEIHNAIRKIEISTGEVTPFAGVAGGGGYANGISSARFRNPTGLTTDGTNLYVADSGNHVIRKVVLATAEVSTFAGFPGFPEVLDGNGTLALFENPGELTSDGTFLYVISTGLTIETGARGKTIRKIKISTAEVTTMPKIQSELESSLTSMTTDGVNLYVTDTQNSIVLRVYPLEVDAASE
jgi:hypothetical protein